MRVPRVRFTVRRLMIAAPRKPRRRPRGSRPSAGGDGAPPSCASPAGRIVGAMLAGDPRREVGHAPARSAASRGPGVVMLAGVADRQPPFPLLRGGRRQPRGDKPPDRTGQVAGLGDQRGELPGGLAGRAPLGEGGAVDDVGTFTGSPPAAIAQNPANRVVSPSTGARRRPGRSRIAWGGSLAEEDGAATRGAARRWCRTPDGSPGRSTRRRRGCACSSCFPRPSSG